MKIEFPFELGNTVHYIDPKTMKAKTAVLERVKIVADSKEIKVKYGLNVPEPPTNEDCLYVWSVFKTKEDLLKSL